MKNKAKIYFVIAIFLLICAFACDIVVIVFQFAESLERYGAIFSGAIIPHWSLWFLLGNFLFIPAYLFFAAMQK